MSDKNSSQINKNEKKENDGALIELNNWAEKNNMRLFNSSGVFGDLGNKLLSLGSGNGASNQVFSDYAEFQKGITTSYKEEDIGADFWRNGVEGLIILMEPYNKSGSAGGTAQGLLAMNSFRAKAIRKMIAKQLGANPNQIRKFTAFNSMVSKYSNIFGYASYASLAGQTAFKVEEIWNNPKLNAEQKKHGIGRESLSTIFYIGGSILGSAILGPFGFLLGEALKKNTVDLYDGKGKESSFLGYNVGLGYDNPYAEYHRQLAREYEKSADAGEVKPDKLEQLVKLVEFTRTGIVSLFSLERGKRNSSLSMQELLNIASDKDNRNKFLYEFNEQKIIEEELDSTSVKQIVPSAEILTKVIISDDRTNVEQEVIKSDDLITVDYSTDAGAWGSR